jgi:hypothetical protein
MAANGISTLSTKQARQAAKLAIATAKRQGKVVAVNGTITGSVDATKTYYRIANTLDTTLLPTLYSGNTVVNNVNTVNSVNGVLVAGRPWSTAAPGIVDTLGFFEQQLDGGTWMTFDETISGIRVQAITTNFNGTWTHGSYIKINGTVIASDHTLSPDGTDNRYDAQGRGVTTTAPTDPSANQYGVGFWMVRGHTITILNPATGLSRTGFPKCYDTYGGAGLAAVGTAGIANDMKNAAVNDIIVMGTYDATSVSAAMRSAMTAYTGSTSTNTWSAVRISHMFLAKRRSTSYVGTLNSVVSDNGFVFNVLKSANPGMAAAIANTGWTLNWTDVRFTNGTFNSQQVNVKTQTETMIGFTASYLTQDATYYTFTSWFGAGGGYLPLGTQFTITW